MEKVLAILPLVIYVLFLGLERLFGTEPSAPHLHPQPSFRGALRYPHVPLKRADDFLDIPGLSMTFEQAQRLFRIDRATCQALFDLLVESAVVKRTPDGSFVRFLPHAA